MRQLFPITYGFLRRVAGGTWLTGAACALLLSPQARAADPLYKVEIDAPGGLQSLLRDNLDIVRWSTRADADSLPLHQLYRTAPEEIRSLLQTQGYFDPKVEATLDEEATPPVAHFKVDPGEPVKVGGLDLRFTGAMENDEQREERIKRARATWTLVQGTTFHQEEWERAKREIAASIASFRYATARVAQSAARIDTDAHNADLEVEVDSGPIITLGAVDVAGMKRYPPSIVLNLNPIERGAAFDQQQLLDYQRRLVSSGYFSTAIVAARTDQLIGNQAPISINVTEAPSQHFELGGGYSTDKGIRGFARYNDINIRERGWRWVNSIDLDRLTQKVSSRIELPPNEQGLRYALGGRIETEDIQGQHTDRGGMSVTRFRTDERNESSTALSFEAERLRAGGVVQQNSHALVPSQSWLLNRTDNLASPRAGYFISAEVGAASKAVLSTQNFVRGVGKAAWLFSPTARDTFQIRAQGGLVAAPSRSGIPSVYLFRTGGDTTVRGYAFESLGVSENGAVVGGRYLAVASGEYTRWLTREWGAALFYDAGNAVDTLKDFKVARGYGTGVRWTSPFGRLALDIAYGEQVHKVRLHFSVGVSFK